MDMWRSASRVVAYLDLTVYIILFLAIMSPVIPCFYEQWALITGETDFTNGAEVTSSINMDTWINCVLFFLCLLAADQLVTAMIPEIPPIQIKLRVNFWRSAKVFALIVRVAQSVVYYVVLDHFSAALTLAITTDLLFIGIVTMFLLELKEDAEEKNETTYQRAASIEV